MISDIYSEKVNLSPIPVTSAIQKASGKQTLFSLK